jgi:hypothetical protein
MIGQGTDGPIGTVFSVVETPQAHQAEASLSAETRTTLERLAGAQAVERKSMLLLAALVGAAALAVSWVAWRMSRRRD